MRMYAWVFALAAACLTGYASAQVTTEATASTTAPPATRSREITMHHQMLRSRDAQQIATLINGLDEARRAMGNLDRVRALGETETNTLLLTGHPSAMEWALELARVMDTITFEDDTFYIYHLKNADARDVVSLVQKSLQPFIEKEELEPGAKPVRTALVADVRGNAVLVSTSTRMEGQIHDLLDKLDRPSLQVRLAVQVIEAQRATGAASVAGEKVTMTATEQAAWIKGLADAGRLGQRWRGEVLGEDGRHARLRMGDLRAGGSRFTLLPRVNPETGITVQVEEETEAGPGVSATVTVRDGEFGVVAELPAAEDGKVSLILIAATVVPLREPATRPR